MKKSVLILAMGLCGSFAFAQQKSTTEAMKEKAKLPVKKVVVEKKAISVVDKAVKPKSSTPPVAPVRKNPNKLKVRPEKEVE